MRFYLNFYHLQRLYNSSFFLFFNNNLLLLSWFFLLLKFMTSLFTSRLCMGVGWLVACLLAHNSARVSFCILSSLKLCDNNYTQSARQAPNNIKKKSNQHMTTNFMLFFIFFFNFFLFLFYFFFIFFFFYFFFLIFFFIFFYFFLFFFLFFY